VFLDRDGHAREPPGLLPRRHGAVDLVRGRPRLVRQDDRERVQARVEAGDRVERRLDELRG
jgi:hypothetical protein